jgi:hypothetical protein
LDWTLTQEDKVVSRRRYVDLDIARAKVVAGSIAAAKSRFPIQGADLIAEFSLPSVEQNFTHKGHR